MNILYFLIPVSILLGSSFLALFILAVNNDQFQDLETPATRILLTDDDIIKHGDES
jgi:cbb3-type cytochrome oxidase maturation protein